MSPNVPADAGTARTPPLRWSAAGSSAASGSHRSPLGVQKSWWWTTTPERWNSAGADIRSTGPDRAGSSRSAVEPSPSAPRLDSEITPESAQRAQQRLEKLVELEDSDDR
ncbi:hypothetical protein [Rhodococcus qingshengii]|uniref:hypothetical protein n=1 Tax=Rhodococcus qingshengii TaxID=334542 RepID=UPI001443D10B|nr:hypothetical protein [Rhodococcus qingshengii]